MDTPERRQREVRVGDTDLGADIRDELALHIEMRVREAIERGVPAETARQEALRAFGDRARIERELERMGRRRLRRERRASMWTGCVVDALHSVRGFLRRPFAPAIIIITLALSIGATTTVFALFQAVVLRPLAVPNPEELFVLNAVGPTGSSGGVAYQTFRALREEARHWRGLALQGEMMGGVRVGDYSDQVSVSAVSGNYFDVLGLTPQRGRLLRMADEGPVGSTPYVVLSDGFWRRAFHASPNAIGRSIRLNGHDLTVIGIAPAGFRGTDLSADPALWLPITMLRSVANGGFYFTDVLANEAFDAWQMFGRLGQLELPGALAELKAIQADRQKQFPAGATWAPRPLVNYTATAVSEAASGRSRSDLMRFVTMLWVVVGLCLAIACVNVANLLLLRSAERSRELAVSIALGAPRARMFRQVLVESVSLALIGGGIGLMLAQLSLRLLSAYSLPGGIELGTIPLSLANHVLLFAGVLSVGCALLFGLAPALLATRPRLASLMVEARHSGTRQRVQAGNVLIAVQVALSLVLVVGALLFTRSLVRALTVDIGYDVEDVAALTVAPRARTPTAAGERPGFSRFDNNVAFMSRVSELAQGRLGGPVAFSTFVPPGDGFRMPVRAAGPSARPQAGFTAVSAVSPGFFEALRIRLLRGRDFAASDRRTAPLVAVVTESAARLFWPGRDPIGQLLLLLEGESPFVVIGVVVDGRYTSLSTLDPHVFVSVFQPSYPSALNAIDELSIIARGPGTAGTTLATLKSIVREADSQIPLFRERAVHQQFDRILMPQRFGTMLLVLFAVMACGISAVGIYAVVAHEVTRRRRELGIRAALGASRRELAGAVLTRTGLAIAVGVGAGLLLAAVTTGGLRRFLFEFTPYEPVSYALAALAFGLVALAATVLPIRRAQSVDPARLIRD